MQAGKLCQWPSELPLPKPAGAANKQFDLGPINVSSVTRNLASLRRHAIILHPSYAAAIFRLAAAAAAPRSGGTWPLLLSAQPAELSAAELSAASSALACASACETRDSTSHWSHASTQASKNAILCGCSIWRDMSRLHHVITEEKQLLV